MGEVTLESLAKRVEELERRLGVTSAADGSAKPRYTITPGTGTWEEVWEAVRTIKDYDFDAVREMDAADVAAQTRATGRSE